MKGLYLGASDNKSLVGCIGICLISLNPFFAAAILGILNAFFRAILLILTLPVNILSLGLFTFVINAIVLMMVSGMISGFEVYGFWSAVFGSLLISLASWLLTSFIGGRGTVQYIDLKNVGGNRWEK